MLALIVSGYYLRYQFTSSKLQYMILLHLNELFTFHDASTKLLIINLIDYKNFV